MAFEATGSLALKSLYAKFMHLLPVIPEFAVVGFMILAWSIAGPFKVRTQGHPVSCRTQRQSRVKNELKVRVGHKAKLCRWVPGSTVLFYFGHRSFGKNAQYARECFLEAIRLWMDNSGVNLSFKETRQEDEATFRVMIINKCVSRRDGDLAQAFFPSDDTTDRTLVVYPLALSNRYMRYLTAIFAHELGHIAGLRHETAEEWNESPSVPFGVSPNKASIMTYPDDAPQGFASWTVQEQDRQDLRAFMELEVEYLPNSKGEKFHKADFAPTPMAPCSSQRHLVGESGTVHLEVGEATWSRAFVDFIRSVWFKVVSQIASW